MTYVAYFVYIKQHVNKRWNFSVDKNFQPSVSILVPVHNEEENIEKKLANIEAVLYPKDKIEIIIVDDASEDKTMLKVEDFTKHHPELNILTVKQRSRSGKSVALNAALPVSSNSIVVVSDADTLWPSDVLEKALPYLAEPSVGAITARGINENVTKSWVTKSEDTYLDFAYLIRLGESKIYSTIRFEGGFCAYKRAAFEQFDHQSGSDYSGTALNVVQRNFRTILVPEAVFYTSFPTSLIGKLRIKVRRANQLISLWIRCLKLMFKKRLRLPKRIVLPEIFLFLIIPFFFLLLVVSAAAFILLFPFSIFSLFILVSVVGLLVFTRSFFLELVVDNSLLVYASINYLLGRRYVAWEKPEKKKLVAGES